MGHGSRVFALSLLLLMRAITTSTTRHSWPPSVPTIRQPLGFFAFGASLPPHQDKQTSPAGRPTSIGRNAHSLVAAAAATAAPPSTLRPPLGGPPIFLIWEAGRHSQDCLAVATATAERLCRKLIVLPDDVGGDKAASGEAVAHRVQGLSQDDLSRFVIGLEASEALLSSAALLRSLKSQAFTVRLLPRHSSPQEQQQQQAISSLVQGITAFDLATGPDDDGVGERPSSPPTCDYWVTEGVQSLVALYRASQQSIKTPQDTLLDMGKNTFFLSLTFGDVREALPLLPQLEAGVDALELRVDLLRDRSEWNVLRQLDILRRHSRLPIIYTVRSKGQCGAFDDDPVALFKLLHTGLRAGVDILDVEANWPMPYRDDLLDKASRYHALTRLLGSYHVVGKPTSEDEARRLFQECYHGGRVDAVKVVLTAFTARDNYLVHEVATSMNFSCPHIALCLGEKGKLSRVLNVRYTPVTSDALPFVAAPGQLSSSALMRLRHELGLLPAQSFYLLGNPISKSPSPAMHNAAFKECQLPHDYALFETDQVENFNTAVLLSQPQFGGASVTIPHKQAIMPFLDRVEKAAQEIGAVNTIIVEEGTHGRRVLVGDNTDWLGIRRPVLRRLGATGQHDQRRVALVVGGGGTAMAAAYAMKSCGFRLVVYNRTPSKAQEIAQRFGGVSVDALTPSALGKHQVQAVDVIISTIPSTAGFTLPDFLLDSRPLVMDVAYRPALTPLLQQAQALGCSTIQGADMLIEQGMEQFQRWTGRSAPREVMSDVVYSKVERVTPPLH